MRTEAMCRSQGNPDEGGVAETRNVHMGWFKRERERCRGEEVGRIASHRTTRGGTRAGWIAGPPNG